jgi:hypothetical protein
VSDPIGLVARRHSTNPEGMTNPPRSPFVRSLGLAWNSAMRFASPPKNRYPEAQEHHAG